ncbi:ATP-binding protein [Blastococcus sp. SYSU DS0533]
MRPEVLRTRTLPVQPAALEALHELITDLWQESPAVPHGDRLRFETAVTEIAGNVVKHAGTAPGRTFTVELTVYPDRLEAHLQDRGRPAAVDLDVVTLPDELAESGRGLALAVAAVDELTYRRDGAVNHWRVVRRRRPEDA